MELVKKVRSAVTGVKKYWKQPPNGRYMTYKEIFSLSMGGMGVKFISFAVQSMILCVGNTLIGNTLGIEPDPLYILYVISIIASIPLTALRANIIDYAKNKKGKYRPYILIMGIPTAVLGIGFTLMPYDSMTMMQKYITILAYNIGFQFFYMFFTDAYGSILNVLSPNTLERSDVCSIKSVTDNFAPSIINIFMPLVAQAVTGERTIYDMRVYRVIYPPILIVGLLMSILIYVNTDEKIIQAKTHTVKIPFIDAFRTVAKNKYFWIISMAGWLGFLETAFSYILGWLYNYQHACSAGQYSLVTAINGNSALWPMIFAPFLIRLLGKRNLLIYSNLANVIFIILMLPVIKYSPSNQLIWFFLIIMFLNGMANSLGSIIMPSINADIRDYHQYITGERVDGMFVTVGIIGSIIGLATNSVLPAIFKAAGLNAEVAVSLGYSADNVYDVLYNADYFNNISSVLIIASAIGAAMNVIPFFFYDLTELKQKAMVTVLNIRALFEDYGNNALTDKSLIEAIDTIDAAYALKGCQPVSTGKEGIRAAKRTHDKEKIKQAKAQRKADREYNNNIFIAGYVVREMEIFDTDYMTEKLANAQKTVNAGLRGLPLANMPTLKQAKNMPKATPEEKERRKDCLAAVRDNSISKRAIEKYYPEGVEEFDSSVFEKLFSADDNNENSIRSCFSALDSAKKARDNAEVSRLRAEMKHLRAVKSDIKKEVTKAEKQQAIYLHAAKPYLEAEKLLVKYENYSHYEEIRAKYDEARAATTES